MLTLRNVSKQYGSVHALQNVSFDIPAGMITGFVGDNGAGKSTAMRAIMGLVEVDCGNINVDGREIDDKYRRGVGYMPEEQGMYPEMTVEDQLIFFARIEGQSRSEARKKVADFLERLGLTDRAKNKISELSLGNRQRVQLISVLLGQRRALILDEPFSGLDPIAVDYMESEIRRYAKLGLPILFSSHQLEIVERICDRVVLISDGVIKAEGNTSTLLSDQVDRAEIWLRPNTPAKTIPGLENIEILEDEIEIGRFVISLANEPMEALRGRINLIDDVVGWKPLRPSLAQTYRILVNDEEVHSS